jgi:uncharacterized protein YrrD
MRSIDIKGLAVFDIASGCEIGKVTELLINAEKKSVQYLVVDVPNWYYGAYVIPFAMTEGIGKDAVMIESASIMKKLNEEPEAITLVESGVSLIGSKALTKKGKFIGRISEIYIDEDTGLITGCELIDNITVKGIIPVKSALTFGKDALIVEEKVEDNLLSTIDDVDSETVPSAPEPEKAAVPVEAGTDEPAAVETEPVPVDPAPESDQVADKPKAVQLYEQKQREYLLGREVKSDIYDDNGTLIIKSGQKITEEILDIAVSSAKLKDLLFHV